MLVLAGVINRDIDVWESDLSTFVRDKYSGIMPSGASTVIEIFPLPARKGMAGFVNGVGCCSPCNPCRLPPLHLQHPAAASTPTSAPAPMFFLHIFAARLLQGEALQIPSRSGRSRRAGGRKHGRQPPRLGIERHCQGDSRRHRWQPQRLGWPAQRLGWHPQRLDIEGGQRGDGKLLTGEAVLLACLLQDGGAGLAMW